MLLEGSADLVALNYGFPESVMTIGITNDMYVCNLCF